MALLSMMLAIQLTLIGQESAKVDPEKIRNWNSSYVLERGILDFHIWPRKKNFTEEEVLHLKLDAESSQIVNELLETRDVFAAIYQFDLQISDKQKQQLDELCEDSLYEIESIAVRVQRERLAEKEKDAIVREFAKKLKGARSDILLGFQLKRIKELRVQLKIQFLVEGLASPEMRETLKITDAQVDAMRKMKPELEDEFVKELNELGKKYRDKLLEELTEKQRRELQKILGTPVPKFGDEAFESDQRTQKVFLEF